MPSAIPIATYRLQLTADFNFDAAAAVVPYLKALGITHLYASPFMKARQGSTHGYDIVDHTKFNPELGGEAGFERLSEALKQHDLGLILDFVPNHVGVHFADNPWWLDVLEWGPASPHAVSFDIDWDMLPYRARGGVLLPIIGSSYGQALEKRRDRTALRRRAKAAFPPGISSIACRSRRSATARSCATIVREAGAEDSAAGKAHSRARVALQGIAPSQSQGSARLQGGVESHRRRRRDHRARARRLSRGTGSSGADLWRCIICWNASTTSSATGGWPPATSTTGASSTSIRWPDCASRMPAPSTPSIAWSKRLIADGRLQGLRLDHIDGLRDPAQYFQRLRRLIRDAQGKDASAVLPGDRENSRRTRKAARLHAACTAPPAMNG